MLTPRPSTGARADDSMTGQTTTNPTVHPSGCAVVTLGGEQDVYVVTVTRRLVRDGVRLGQGHVIVDLTAVTFADSSLLGALVLAVKLARRSNGTVRLVTSDEHLIRKLHLTGLARLFPIFSNLADALGEAP